VKTFSAVILTVALALLWGGCGPPSSRPDGAEKPELHQSHPPHGGTAVALGEDYALELVRDPATGTLSAYVLDDEMEDFIRSPDSAITVQIQAGGSAQTLFLAAIANPATGERVGDTSLFEGRADWLEAAGPFAGVLQQITVRGTPFRAVPFTIPAVRAKD
jgi:hypothetical protein